VVTPLNASILFILITKMALSFQAVAVVAVAVDMM
jgi:hypothetical protein